LTTLDFYGILGARKERNRHTKEGKMDIKQITTKDLQGLINSEIVQVRGISGARLGGPHAANAARHLCPIVRMHATSGHVYDLVAYIAEMDTFNIERVQ
jgi:hypothetical protein